MIYIRTIAYNAQDTVRQCIESILKQTYREFKYYILDNGSTDTTGDIIKEYAQKDKRIVPFFSYKNHDYSQNQNIWLLDQNLNQDDYFATLDADDYYDEHFLESMVRYMKEYNLDMACAGGWVFSADQNEFRERQNNDEVIIFSEPKDIDEKYVDSINYFDTTWGRLYNYKAAKLRYKIGELVITQGSDEASQINILKNVNRVGVFPDKLHYYRLSPKSVSFVWTKNRDKAAKVLYELQNDLFLTKCGYVSERNQEYMYYEFLNTTNAAMNVLVNSSEPIDKKINIINQVLDEPILWSALNHTFKEWTFTDRNKAVVLMSIVKGLAKDITKMTELNVGDLISISKRCGLDISELIEPGQMIWYRDNLPEIPMLLYGHKYDEAIECITNYIESKCTDFITEEMIIELALNVAAISSNENAYISMSKIYIEFLLKCNKRDRAAEMVAEWLQMLPDDADIQEYRRVLENKISI